MKILIKVTKDVLKRSMYCNSNVIHNCAVAVAVRDLFPNGSVGISTIGFGVNHAWVALPRFVQNWIETFDSTAPKERLKLPELSFQIIVPESVIQQIGIGQVYKVLSESKTMEMVME